MFLKLIICFYNCLLECFSLKTFLLFTLIINCRCFLFTGSPVNAESFYLCAGGLLFIGIGTGFGGSDNIVVDELVDYYLLVLVLDLVDPVLVVVGVDTCDDVAVCVLLSSSDKLCILCSNF